MLSQSCSSYNAYDHAAEPDAVWQETEVAASAAARISPGRQHARTLHVDEPVCQAMRLAVAVLLGLTLGGLFYSHAGDDGSTSELTASSRSSMTLAVLPVSRVKAAA